VREPSRTTFTTVSTASLAAHAAGEQPVDRRAVVGEKLGTQP